VDAPAAEIDVDAALVARLIEAQHPDLAGDLTPVANGWDNVIYRLGADLCVRLPRRRVAVELIRTEQRWLPLLARRLPVPVPVPVRAGAPGAGYPWPWSITPWYEGRLAADLPPPARCPADLARFLAALHTPAPPDAPRNPVRGVPLADRAAAVAERLSSGAIPYAAELRAVWESARCAPAWSGPPLWLHGDPHPANLLVRVDAGEAPRLSAVLDFGDLTAGDPATDLAAAWLGFDAAGRRIFREAMSRLGGVDEPTWTRARGWALAMGTAMVLHSDDHPRIATIGRHALHQVLADW
jgi:aminoglycoside phosphotransferase (APT) family kinase protein